MPSPPLIYTFQPDKKISREFVRVLGEISRQGRSLMQRSREPMADSIHEGRLLIKRLRALLWFARPALDASAYARTRTQLRKAAGLLSAQRDLAVIHSTLEELAQKASKARDRTAPVLVLQSLVPNPSARETQEKALRSALKKAVRILCQSVNEIKRTVADDSAWPTPGERLAKAFRAMHKAGKKARRTGTDAAFHEWRKKSKRLLYQLELTQAEPGRPMKHVEKLQDKLGAYHDCVVVEDRLRRLLPLPPAERRTANLLKKRKLHLRKKACKIARDLKSSPS